MSKRLVVCCDGTWNTPDQLSDGVTSPTSVAKLALGVSREDRDGISQLLYYQAGVGTRRFARVGGGTFGCGLSRNVCDAYRFVVENYEPGDELYFFGFSRGAYTARSTIGLIRNSGILHAEHRDRIKEAYRLYRSRADHNHPKRIEAQIFRRMYSHDDIDIRFVGVWDTVGALGIPIGGVRLPFMAKYLRFHDTKLSSKVRSAYHALAIDEERGPFKPTLWEQQAGARHQTLEQVWFAGAHRDVGGGTADPALSEIPLLWMVKCASDCGLEFEPGHFVVEDVPVCKEARALGKQLAPDPMGPIHQSRSGFYRVLPRYSRKLGYSDGQSAASSAVRRLRQQRGYNPANLQRWTDTGARPTTVQDGPVEHPLWHTSGNGNVPRSPRSNQARDALRF